MGGIFLSHSICLIFIFCIFSHHALSSSFAPIHIREKVEDSDAVVLGTVVRSYYSKDNRKNINTIIVLDVKKSAGLKSREIILPKDFKIRYMGGEWEGQVQEIAGAPKFSIGEEVIVLLRHHKSLFWVHHLAAGKFSLIKKVSGKFLQSEIFSDKDGVGRIPLSEFNQILQNSHLGTPLSYNPRENKAFIAGHENGSEFSPARKLASQGKSTHHSSKDREEEDLFVVFFIIIGFIFALATWLIRKNGAS